MKEISDEPIFFIGVSAAYFLVSVVILMIYRIQIFGWRTNEIELPSSRKYNDLVIVILVVFGIFGMGQIYRRGFLFKDNHLIEFSLTYIINTCVIYSPILIALLIRRQSLDTVFINARSLSLKVIIGFVLSGVSCVLYCLIVGKSIEQVLRDSFTLKNLSNFPAVFFEGVAVAFVFVRINKFLPLWVAIIAPSFLFAVGHVPSQIQQNEGVGLIFIYLIFNTFLPSIILYAVSVTKDVIWIGIVHYFMDVAIGVFN